MTVDLNLKSDKYLWQNFQVFELFYILYGQTYFISQIVGTNY